jgi:hypothetical protein
MATSVVITDENQQIIRSVDAGKNPRAFSLHPACVRMTCCWHKIELYGINNVSRLYHRTDDYQHVMRIFRSAYKQAESDAEVDELFDCIREIADPARSESDPIMTAQSYQSLECFLDSLQGAETRITWTWV